MVEHGIVRRGFVGANLGKNRDSADATADYCRGVAALAPLVDYLVINVSSPNTPGLRALQRRSALEDLLDATTQARDALRLDRPPPLLVKIAPDLTEDEAAEIARVAVERALDGLIISNTTVTRPPTLRSPSAPEPGGLSGAPLFDPSTRLLARMYRRTRGVVPLIGVGGVASGEDAYAKIRAGASLVQLYTALVYDGLGLVTTIKHDLAALLRRDGFTSVAAAVGADVSIAGRERRRRNDAVPRGGPGHGA
jgi:dihydroorotate dehydrogenase